MTRREFVAGAAAMGATLAWGETRPWRSRERFTERRDLFPQGVASGDPAPDSVLLWTRRVRGRPAAVVPLTVEVAEDAAFERVVATRSPRARSAAADCTCRVLVGGLQPGRAPTGIASSTRTGHGSRDRPHAHRARPRRPAAGALRVRQLPERLRGRAERLSPDDLRGRARRARRPARLRAAPRRLHLRGRGVPGGQPGGHRYDRRIRDVVRYPGRREGAARLPHSGDASSDYRALYRAYLQDPDLQDARARWPFVRHVGQPRILLAGLAVVPALRRPSARPAQTLKVAANQAWFEYQPARVAQAERASLERFDAPAVTDAPDRALRRPRPGPGAEQPRRDRQPHRLPRAALRPPPRPDHHRPAQLPLRGADRAGRRPTRSRATTSPSLFPEEVDARSSTPAAPTTAAIRRTTIRFGDKQVPNFRKDAPPQTILGAEQKAWFLDRLRALERDLEDLGQFARRARLARRSAEPARRA